MTNATDFRDASGAPLEDDATYAAFLLTSLRANAGMHQHGIVSGADAKAMIANSSDARYLHFELIAEDPDFRSTGRTRTSRRGTPLCPTPSTGHLATTHDSTPDPRA